VQLGKVSVMPSSVQKTMSSGGSGTTEVMAHPWQTVGERSKVEKKKENICDGTPQPFNTTLPLQQWICRAT